MSVSMAKYSTSGKAFLKLFEWRKRDRRLLAWVLVTRKKSNDFGRFGNYSVDSNSNLVVVEIISKSEFDFLCVRSSFTHYVTFTCVAACFHTRVDQMQTHSGRKERHIKRNKSTSHHLHAHIVFVSVSVSVSVVFLCIFCVHVNVCVCYMLYVTWYMFCVICYFVNV